MNARLACSLSLLTCMALMAPAMGETQSPPATTVPTAAAVDHEAPIYDSADNANRLTSFRFSSPEDDARPGEYYFGLAVHAFRKRNYSFAISMYKVAAAWAYKPAEYNLGVMYARGTGVKRDLPRAMAWLTLAAERNDKTYLSARDLINSKLSDAQFEHANTIFGELLPTYGDATALIRAKSRWAQVRASMTGSRVGSLAGNLRIGTASLGSRFGPQIPSGGNRPMATSGFQLLGGGSTDGAIAYSQLVSTNNPYDAKFEWRPGHQNVTVGALSPASKHTSNSSPESTTEPQDPSTGNSSHR